MHYHSVSTTKAKHNHFVISHNKSQVEWIKVQKEMMPWVTGLAFITLWKRLSLLSVVIKEPLNKSFKCAKKKGDFIEELSLNEKKNRSRLKCKFNNEKEKKNMFIWKYYLNLNKSFVTSLLAYLSKSQYWQYLGQKKKIVILA